MFSNERQAERDTNSKKIIKLKYNNRIWKRGAENIYENFFVMGIFCILLPFDVMIGIAVILLLFSFGTIFASEFTSVDLTLIHTTDGLPFRYVYSRSLWILLVHGRVAGHSEFSDTDADYADLCSFISALKADENSNEMVLAFDTGDLTGVCIFKLYLLILIRSMHILK